MTHVRSADLEVATVPDVDDGRWYVVIRIRIGRELGAHVYDGDALVDLVNELVVAGMRATERNHEREHVGDDLNAIAAGLGDGL